MELAVFLRAINVGKRTLKTAEFAASLTVGRAVNLGAAGTFAIADAPSERAVRDELATRLPFPTEVAVVPRDSLRQLLALGTSDTIEPEPGRRESVTFLTAPPPGIPPLPIIEPVGAPWEVRLIAYEHPFVRGAHVRRRPDRVRYPNEVVERTFGVPATTRWWETLQEVEAAFESFGPSVGAVAPAARRPRAPAARRSGSRAPTGRDPAPSGRRTPPRTPSRTGRKRGRSRGTR